MVTLNASVVFVSDQQGGFRIIISHRGGNERSSRFVGSVPLHEHDVKI